MKKIYFLVLLVSASPIIYAQQDWTWINGSKTARIPASYGIAGKPNSANNPGARTQSVQWKDKDGNLWLFGGQTFGPTATTYVPPPMLLSDLWKYDVASGNWTWISGDTIPNQPGRYRANTNPGARRSALSWTDANGAFWLFGGFGYGAERLAGCLNDLWQYTAAKGWVWVGGSLGINNLGQYAAINVSTGKNVPGSRYESTGWTDTNGYLWLYGGWGYGDRDTGLLSDLWKLNIKSGEWTWVNGNGTVNLPSAYHARLNRPGGRAAAIGWTDPSGIMWLFGGEGIDVKQRGLLSDLWQFDPVAGGWNFAGGNETINQSGDYGQRNVPAFKNKPGGRMDAVGYTDSNGDAWMIGGNGYGTTKNGLLSDSWRLNTKSGLWTWINGSAEINNYGVYGKANVPDASNMPGGRAGALVWVDRFNLPWLFGGIGLTEKESGYLNDLWHMQTLQLPSKPLLSCPASTSLNNDTSCAVRVTGIDPILSGDAKTSYTLTGASLASGAGSASGLLYNPGVTKVTYRLLTDTSTCFFTVTVEDRQPPVPLLSTLPEVIGNCSVTVTTTPKAKDNCAGIVTGITVDSLTYTRPGKYLINWVYNDGHGNSSKQQQTVIVQTAGKLTPLVPSLPVVTGECSVTITAIPRASKDCDGIFTATTTDPLTYTQQGEYHITWLFNDGNGNSMSQQQTVLVKDSTAPVPVQANLPTLTGDCGITVTDRPTATDNCAGMITGTTQDSLTYSKPGEYNINWIFTDGHKNTTIQQQKVIVKGSAGQLTPLVTALPDITAECSVTVTDIPVASKSCGGLFLATTTDPLTYQHPGVYTITWTFKDNSGAGLQQLQRVVIKDNQAPHPLRDSLPDITGECSITITDKPMAMDDCAGKITATTVDPLVYTKQGSYIIHWVYNDGNGNVQTQQQKLVLKVPVVLVPRFPLPPIISECAITVNDRPTLQDYCLGTITAFTTDSLYFEDPGTYVIHWKYITSHEDTITQLQSVTVRKLSLDVSAWPNPSNNHFTLTPRSCDNNAPIVLRVYDLLGRIIETRTVKPFVQIVLGDKYPDATYIIQLIQGSARHTQKLIKMQ